MDPVIIVDHDSGWPTHSEGIRDRVATAMGGLAISIEHVGSTSGPGLAAKPIIDMDVVVASATEVPEGIRRLATIGYSHQGDLGIAGREAFSAPAGTAPHHPYLCAADSVPLQEHLRFREVLRSDHVAAARCARLKRGPRSSPQPRSDRVCERQVPIHSERAGAGSDNGSAGAMRPTPGAALPLSRGGGSSAFGRIFMAWVEVMAAALQVRPD